ncbi:MAG: hypothetical protein CVU57_00460 [Deltaproteobacteria bacterium HGW-Deltaproteobacteria-15]|jgi:hypothetical protein|nr:MAG: hypothetical protein CVU57_00460 [Deltaproteobacteria bacterium HGW-Deltaproteobacteria-15]
MRIVAHLVLGRTDLDWTSGEPRQRLDESLAMLSALSFDTTPLFLSDSTIVLNRASTFELQTRRLDIDPNKSLPGDTLGAVAAQPGETGPTLFLDLRNPLLDADLVSLAMDLSDTHGLAPVIGIRTPCDHPFFLFTAGKLLSCGLLHLLADANRRPGGEVRTRPFFFDWARRGLPDGDTVSPGVVLHTDLSGVRWICEDAHTARAAFPAVGLPGVKGMLLACALPKEAQNASELILYQGEDGLNRLATPLKGRLRLKLYPFDEGGLRPGHGYAFELVQQGDNGSQAIVDQEALPLGTTGWFYNIETAMEGGEVDVERPFQPCEPCWVGDKNQLTGETIAGRQQVPEVWEPDLSLVLCRPDEVFHLEELFAQGRLQGLPLPGKGPLETRLDFLRFKAALRERK